MLYVERQALLGGCTLIAFPPDLDTGIDGFLEFPHPNGSRLVALQVKKGLSFFDSRGARCHADTQHLRGWSIYAVPVILVVVRNDESEAFWMNVTQYVHERPEVLSQRSHVLRPSQRFNVASIRAMTDTLATAFTFGDSLKLLLDTDPAVRAGSVSLFYPLRNDKRTPFCLSTAIREERDRAVMSGMCDFYSRYLPHPEFSFGVEQRLRDYATRLLVEAPRQALITMLEAFGDDDEIGDWSGMGEIYGIREDEIWGRHSIITRGTVQQGIAEVVGAAANSDRLWAIVADDTVPISERRAAAGLFGYLGFSCRLEELDALRARSGDDSLSAILFWLRYWIRVEADGETID